jgi:polyhydroxyalkanoate synthesis regulator phasin
MDDETVENYHEKANLEQLVKQNMQDSNSFRKMLLAQDQWKQEIMDGLLNIRRKTIPMTDEEGKTYLQDFIRLEDGTGRWKQVGELSDDELDEIKSGGIINEQGAKFVLGHLESVTNNNIALSNMTQEQINKVCREAELSLRNKLINNRGKFDIDSTDDVKEIVSSIVRPNMIANFSKAKNGQFVTEILREIRMVGSMDDEEDDEGWMARLS